MSYETNPFRLSMLQRSESPFEASPQPELAPLESTWQQTLRPQQPQASPQPQLQQQPVPRAAPPAQMPRRAPAPAPAPASSNPFRVELSEPEAPALLEPPPYYESEKRRHSDPNITDEKSRLAADESFREGYERGMRMARERERERQRRRRERSEHGHERGYERGHGERHRSDRDRYSSSDRDPQNRQRSKSESHHRNSYRGSHHSSSSRKHHSTKPNESLDVIDKMDVTGFYGPGTFHHDGPFDACTPHRNKVSARGAIPIAAFPADGPNNSLAIENPHDAAFRKEEEVYGRTVDPPPEMAQNSFDPHERATPVHGQRTMGLGSTTFLDGTPASRDAIEQAGRERSVSFGRSKSLLRRANSGARRPQYGQRHVSDPDYASSVDVREEQPKMSLLSRVRSLRR